MKYVLISHLAPGPESVKRAFEVFGRVGAAEGTQALYAATDGKTFITVVEADEHDMERIATYGPFFDQVTVLPVVDVDEAWMEAMGRAMDNLG